MKLLLHIGTEKTGSSFLQYLCAKNRKLLLAEGVYFPGAGNDERRLLQGRISPGNALDLARLIENRNWPEVDRWLQVRVQAAKSKGCDSILLSHELLYAALSHPKSFAGLVSSADRSGVEKLTSLLMIRDPVDQAISLYKHRAKNGSIDEIENWLRTSYEVPREIGDFLDQIGGSSIELTVKKYAGNSEKIVRVFFREWLKLQVLPDSIEKVVNPSLTFSELRLIRHLAVTRTTSVSLIYDALLAVPREHKARDNQLEEYARATVTRYISSFDAVWTRLDLLLADQGGIAVPRLTSAPVRCHPEYAFSDAQLVAIAEALSEEVSLVYRAKTWVVRFLRIWRGWLRAVAKSIAIRGRQ